MRSFLALLALPISLAAPASQQSPPIPTGNGDLYVITLKPGVSVEGTQFEAVEPLHTYNFEKYKGIVASLTADQVAKISEDPQVSAYPLSKFNSLTLNSRSPVSTLET